MPRLPHGQAVTQAALRQAHAQTVAETAQPLLFAAVRQSNFEEFDYLFPELQADDDALLPAGPATVENLRKLGQAMAEANVAGEDSDIPSAYTYFGQFIDHDITLEALSGNADAQPGGLFAPDLKPLSLEQARATLRNGRTATLDLDSVYSGDVPTQPGNPNKLALGRVTPKNDPLKPNARPPGKDDENDVPRLPPSANPETDRAARIGDPRNDENTIISQLQVAFLKAHNRLVDLGYNFDQARRILRQHYQQVVVNDFLAGRIADKAIVNSILKGGNKFYNGLANPFFLPLEFTVAAYRFGHSMVRADYDFNLNFNHTPVPPEQGRTFPASLELLFSFTAKSGGLGGNDHLPDNWIIEWENILDGHPGPAGNARRLDTKLAAVVPPVDGDIPQANERALFNLQKITGGREDGLAAHLSVRNLLRGYKLRMPTGQKVAAALGLPPLTPQELRAATNSPAQAALLQQSGFDRRTPLWFYILAEASHVGGKHLGPVGSTIVAEVLIGLVRRSQDSILGIPGWRAALPAAQPGRFMLADLLRFAGVLGTPPTVTTHVVAAGDTLSGIAKKRLGAGARWPEIFAANRTIVRNPDVLVPGMRLIIPSGPAPAQQQRFVVVRPGDTLFKLAAQHLANGDRWPEIFTENAAVIANPNVIQVGQVLLIPPKE